MKRLLIIDAHSIIHRAYHAMPPLTSPDKQPVQAVYGLARLLIALLEQEAPDYLVAASDPPGPTFRNRLDETYKAHRPAAPDDLKVQFQEVHRLFGKLGIPVIEITDFEADDVIGTLVKQFKDEKDLKIEILSSDKDLHQLIEGKKVIQRTFKKGMVDTLEVDAEGVLEKLGVRPGQVIDYKAFVGDPSDGIVGVRGIGPKTAIALLDVYPTVDLLLEHLDEAPKLAKKLEVDGARELMLLSRDLATIRQDVPIGVEGLEDLVRKPLHRDRVLSYFSQLGFVSLVRKLEKSAPQEEKKPTAKKGLEVVAGDGGESIAIDAYVADPTVRKHEEPVIGFGIKESLKELWSKDADLTPPYDDLGIAAWLLYPDHKQYDQTTITPLVTGKEQAPLSTVRAKLLDALDSEQLLSIYQNFELPTVRLLAEIESWGISVKRKELEKLIQKVEGEVIALNAKIEKLAGRSFNLNSPKQMGEVLFDELGLEMPGSGKRSTRAEILEQLREVHPIVDHILSYRELFKMQTSFLEPILDKLDEKDVLRTEYVQTGSATGRLSSRNPNLQNIPQGNRFAKDLRNCFVARKGFQFVSLDYSQLELRVVAALSKDSEMTQAFNEGQDIHSTTASIVLGKKITEITADERRVAKTLNFGLVYGMGVRAFSKASGLPQKEAKVFIEKYFERFGAVKAWQEEILESARQKGYTETLTGRRRYFPILQSGGAPWIVAESERAAINHPVQGLDADITKIATINIKDLLIKEKAWGTDARILLTIHDELLLEVATSRIETLIPQIREVMETALPELSVPLVVDAKSGTRWGSLKPYIL